MTISPVIGHGTVPGDEQVQWLLRFSYIPAGLDFLFSKAENLRDFMIVIEKATNKMNMVYDIYNDKASSDDDIKINVPDPSMATGAGSFSDASADFDPTAYTGGAVDRVSDLQDLKSQIDDLIAELNAIPGADATFAEQLQRVSDSISGVSDLNTLIKWQNNFNPATDGGFDPGSLTVTDSTLVQGLAVGNIIRDALAASQASNERARQDLRSALFTFEEFIKSAGSLMDRISRMIEKFATGASGR